MAEYALDIRTMAVIAALATVLQALALFLLWVAAPTARGTKEWAIGGAMLAAGMLLISFRKLAPDFVSIVVANTLIASAHIAYMVGLERFLERRPSYEFGYLAISSVVILFLVFTYLSPDLASRIIVISFIIAATAGLCALRILKAPEALKSKANILLTGVFLTHATFLLFRGAYTYLVDQGISDFMQASTVHGLAFADIIIFSFAAGFGFAVITVTRLNDALAEQLQDRASLMSIIAHDIRSPFNGLMNLSAIIPIHLANGRPEEAEALSRQVARSASEVFGLLEDVVEWGHSELNEGPRPVKTLRLDNLVGAELRGTAGRIRERGLSVSNRVQGELVSMNENHAKMVIRNLLSNAIKFSPPGGSIEISSGVVDGVRLLEFTNAISDDHSGADQKEGMGVGLELCSRICAKHGHRLETFKNDPGRFTARFWNRSQIAGPNLNSVGFKP